MSDYVIKLKLVVVKKFQTIDRKTEENKVFSVGKTLHEGLTSPKDELQKIFDSFNKTCVELVGKKEWTDKNASLKDYEPKEKKTTDED